MARGASGTPIHRIGSPDEFAEVLRAVVHESGALPGVTCVVPSRPLTHRAQVACERLAGVHFRFTHELATDVLLGRGIARHAGADDYRALAVEALLGSDALEGRLRYFRLAQLRTGAGYAEAIARTLCELAEAGVTPNAMRAAADNCRPGGASEGRLHDLAAVWDALGRLAGAPVERTRAALLREATQLLDRDPAAWTLPGPVLAWIGEETSNVDLELLARVPDLRVAYQWARPVRPESHARLAHVAALLAMDPATLADPGVAPRSDAASELQRLQADLFLPPAAETDPRPAAGFDRSVILEEHAGVEDELAATVEWITQQVIDRGRPLERVAVLVPARDPYVSMLVARLSELPWPDGDAAGDGLQPLHVSQGLPATGYPQGARMVTLLAALQASLSADAMARLVPYLRLAGPVNGREHLSFADAVELVWSCGTLGGLAGRPQGASDWPPALARRQADLEATLAEQSAEATDDPEETRSARVRRAVEHELAAVRGLRPAVDALVAVHDRVLEERPVGEVWGGLRDLAQDWVLGRGRLDLLPRMDDALAGFLRSGFAGRVGGRPSLRIIREALDELREPEGRFGQPRCYIGTVAGAAGLSFDAVRILGLAEGAFPARPAVDPILPDGDRALLEPAGTGRRAIPRRDDRPWLDFRAFHRVVQGVREELVLSIPRQGIDGAVREPSGLLLEVAAALRRPSADPNDEFRPVPTLSGLRRTYLTGSDGPPRPLTPRAFATAVAVRPDPGQAIIPEAWGAAAGPALNPERIGTLLGDPHAGPLDGLLGDDWPVPRMPGLSPQTPISASRLKTLLECPNRFLLERVLGWEEPAGAPETRAIGQPSYGGLVHVVLEKLFEAHGAAITAREGTLDAWCAAADTLAESELAEFLHVYALLDGPVRAQQLRRLQTDVRRFLTHEWDARGGLTYLDVERAFGFPDAVRLDLGDDLALWVHGYIDRLDGVGDGLLIRDYKTGKPHPRAGDEADPTPAIDVQLVVYGLAAEAMRASAIGAGEPAPWGALHGVAYVYPDDQGQSERAWADADLAPLMDAGRSWLRLAAKLLTERAFPRTTVDDDCRYCPFTAVCGDDAREEAGRRLAAETGAVADFLALKRGIPADADGTNDA